jgi:hypothetical protein
MPDIEAMELAERFFEIGAKVVGTPHPVAIFLAGCQECLAEWEVLAIIGERIRPRLPRTENRGDGPAHPGEP